MRAPNFVKCLIVLLSATVLIGCGDSEMGVGTEGSKPCTDCQDKSSDQYHTTDNVDVDEDGYVSQDDEDIYIIQNTRVNCSQRHSFVDGYSVLSFCGKSLTDPYTGKNDPYMGYLAWVHPNAPQCFVDAQKLMFLFHGYTGFRYDDSDVNSRMAGKLTELADWLKTKRSIKKIYIFGHTDPKGTHAYNDELGADRAESVMTFLKDQGLKMSMVTRSFGERNLLKVGIPEDSHQRQSVNRRVEIFIEFKGSESSCDEDAFDPSYDTYPGYNQPYGRYIPDPNSTGIFSTSNGARVNNNSGVVVTVNGNPVRTKSGGVVKIKTSIGTTPNKNWGNGNGYTSPVPMPTYTGYQPKGHTHYHNHGPKNHHNDGQSLQPGDMDPVTGLPVLGPPGDYSNNYDHNQGQSNSGGLLSFLLSLFTSVND